MTKLSQNFSFWNWMIWDRFHQNRDDNRSEFLVFIINRLRQHGGYFPAKIETKRHIAVSVKPISRGYFFQDWCQGRAFRNHRIFYKLVARSKLKKGECEKSDLVEGNDPLLHFLLVIHFPVKLVIWKFRRSSRRQDEWPSQFDMFNAQMLVNR